MSYPNGFVHWYLHEDGFDIHTLPGGSRRLAPEDPRFPLIEAAIYTGQSALCKDIVLGTVTTVVTESERRPTISIEPEIALAAAALDLVPPKPEPKVLEPEPAPSPAAAPPPAVPVATTSVQGAVSGEVSTRSRWGHLDAVPNEDLRSIDLSSLRKYARHCLDIIGASKIPGGKKALISRIVQARAR